MKECDIFRGSEYTPTHPAYFQRVQTSNPQDAPAKHTVNESLSAEFDKYFREPPVPLSHDPLNWWKENCHRYPHVSVLAINICVYRRHLFHLNGFSPQHDLLLIVRIHDCLQNTSICWSLSARTCTRLTSFMRLKKTVTATDLILDETCSKNKISRYHCLLQMQFANMFLIVSTIYVRYSCCSVDEQSRPIYSVVISRSWSRYSSAFEFIFSRSRSRSRDLMAKVSVLVSRPKIRSWQQHAYILLRWKLKTFSLVWKKLKMSIDFGFLNIKTFWFEWEAPTVPIGYMAPRYQKNTWR